MQSASDIDDLVAEALDEGDFSYAKRLVGCCDSGNHRRRLIERINLAEQRATTV